MVLLEGSGRVERVKRFGKGSSRKVARGLLGLTGRVAGGCQGQQERSRGLPGLTGGLPGLTRGLPRVAGANRLLEGSMYMDFLPNNRI